MQYVVARFVLRRFAILAFASLLVLQFTHAGNAQVTLTWNRSSDPTVTGYRAWYGAQSHAYTNVIDVLNTTNCAIPNLSVGTTYYFAVTAYASDRLESDFSVEVFTTVGASNSPPWISTTVTNVAVAQGATTAPLPFAVSDAQTPATALVVSGISDNQGLVKNSAIILSGASTNRSVTITAASGQTGVANITLTVTDGSSPASTSFQVNVRTKPQPPGKLHPKG